MRFCLVKQFLAACFEENIFKKKGVALKTNQFLKHKIKTHVKKQQSSEFFQDEGIVPLDSCLFVHMRNVGVLG